MLIFVNKQKPKQTNKNAICSRDSRLWEQVKTAKPVWTQRCLRVGCCGLAEREALKREQRTVCTWMVLLRLSKFADDGLEMDLRKENQG